METLPVEMVEVIAADLTLQDLARCSAVCRAWREVFNQDWVWKPHCDPELAEPLRTTPCVVTPAFVTPEAENSTLSSICDWKMALLRENHLWKNWRNTELKLYKAKKMLNFGNKTLIDLDFLTDTLVVLWYSNCIEILDVSIAPPWLAAKTDTIINIEGGSDKCRVIGTAMLLLEKHYSIEVFCMDFTKRAIELKHNISIGTYPLDTYVKGQFYVHMDSPDCKLTICDLYTGEILKVEPRPVEIYDIYVYYDIFTGSETCEFIAVGYSTKYDIFECYMYNLQQFSFLPGPVVETNIHSTLAVHGHWLAVVDETCRFMKVYDFLTREILLNFHLQEYEDWITSTFATIEVYKGKFIFIVGCYKCESQWLGVYSPSYRTWSLILDDSECQFKVINNKFVALRKYLSGDEDTWKLPLKIVQKCDVRVINYRYSKVNRSFTKMLKYDWSDRKWYVLYLW